MKRIGLAWRVVVWLISIGWTPVVLEEFFEGLFHLPQRSNDITILIIPYMEFVTAPLTCIAALVALYRGAKATIGFLRRDEKSN